MLFQVLVFGWYVIWREKNPNERWMELICNERPGTHKGCFSFYGPLPKRKYSEFEITNHIRSSTLYLLKQELRKMVKKNDTINGIHIHFNGKSKYSSFVVIADMMNYERVKIYVWYDYDMWAFCANNYRYFNYIGPDILAPR